MVPDNPPSDPIERRSGRGGSLKFRHVVSVVGESITCRTKQGGVDTLGAVRLLD